MTYGIITPEEMYAAERAAFEAGLESFEAMRRAGTAVAIRLQERFPEGPVQVLCGPGGNGGDGFVAAAYLKGAGRAVKVYLLGEVDRLSGDPARAAALWDGPVYPLGEASLTSGQVTLDGLFGGGLSRPLEGTAENLSTVPGPVVSVDVPSGLDGLRAKPLGPCFEADLTVTFSAYRPAHMLSPGRGYCGEVCVEEIGIPVSTTVWENNPSIWETPTEGPSGASNIQVLTPEAMSTQYPEAVRAARNDIEALQTAATSAGEILILRENETLVAAPGGRCAVDRSTTRQDKLETALSRLQTEGQPSFETACRAVWTAVRSS